MYGMHSMVKSQFKDIKFTNGNVKYELYVDWSIIDNLTLELRNKSLPEPEYPDENYPIWESDFDLIELDNNAN